MKARETMRESTAKKATLWLSTAVVGQVLLMPILPHLAPALFVGVVACTASGGLLIWRYAPR